jgi:hypothetical protein
LNKVLKLGWTPELFGRFDKPHVSHYSHGASSKSETIGQKYLWIALHELLAYTADNFEFSGETYQGTWQIGARDIDATCLILKSNAADYYQDPDPKCWWVAKYNSWSLTKNNSVWIKNYTDIQKLVDEFTHGLGVDAVIVTAASKDNGPIELAGEITRDRGRVCAVGDFNLEIHTPFPYVH